MKHETRSRIRGMGHLLIAGSLLLLPLGFGHGGTYTGPGDTVPPGGGGGSGGRPVSPPPGSPGNPSGPGPTTPSPGSPNAPAGRPGGMPQAPRTGMPGAGVELLAWQFWWGFNKNPYLNLRSKIHGGTVETGSAEHYLGKGQRDQSRDTLKPNEEQIRDEVVPALLRALKGERDNDVLTGVLIALAKIGDATNESGESEFEQVFLDYLPHASQEVAETAAISLGILANEATIPLLVSLLKDERRGREAVGSTEVPYRTRAFAAYGLGLIGYQTNSNATRQEIVDQLVQVLDSPKHSTRDIKVAAMSALGLTPLDPTNAEIVQESNRRRGSAERLESRRDQIAYLLDWLDVEGRNQHDDTRHWFVRAHVPTALARLVQDGSEDLKVEVADALIRAVGRHSKLERPIRQGATLALGAIGDADGDSSRGPKGVDTRIRETLLRLMEEGQGQVARFAIMGLGLTGGRPGDGDFPLAGTNVARQVLGKTLASGKTGKRPWAALAAGVMGWHLRESDQAPDNGLSLALLDECHRMKKPDHIGAYAIALGMRNVTESKDLLGQRLRKGFMGSDLARGEIAVALGLLGERDAIVPITEVVLDSKYRPELLTQAAIGLGLLGDKEIVPELVDMLKEAKGFMAQASIAGGLGAIGDSRSIDPLVTVLDDKQLTTGARAFAAAALGIVCDKEELPWASKISVGINYRANTSTLTGQGQGILDIL